MATALNVPVSGPNADGAVVDMLSSELRTRQQNIAEITEMIHVSFLVFLIFFNRSIHGSLIPISVRIILFSIMNPCGSSVCLIRINCI